MKNSRRLFLSKMAIGCGMLFLNGCVTHSLYQDPRYREVISSVLISSDGMKLVAQGKNYHYIFDAPVTIVKLLQSNLHPYVSGYFNSFSVYRSQEITGNYVLTLNESTPESFVNEAVALGFTIDSSSKAKLVYRGNLCGIRYLSGGVAPQQATHQLNDTHTVVIETPASASRVAARIVLTPVTVAVDGITVLAGVVLMPIFLFGLESYKAVCGVGGKDCKR